jgi:hypothetical protein
MLNEKKTKEELLLKIVNKYNCEAIHSFEQNQGSIKNDASIDAMTHPSMQ